MTPPRLTHWLPQCVHVCDCVCVQEEKSGEKRSEAKAVKLYGQIPPIEKMDASLSTLTNCEWVVQTGRRLIKSEVLHLFMLNCAGQQNRRTPRNSLKNSSSGRFGPNTHPSNPSRVFVSLSSQETVSVHKLHREDNKPQRPEWVLTTHTHPHTLWPQMETCCCNGMFGPSREPEDFVFRKEQHQVVRRAGESHGTLRRPGDVGETNNARPQVKTHDDWVVAGSKVSKHFRFDKCKMFSFIFSYLCHKKNITTRNSVFIPTLLTWQHVDLKPTTQVQQIQDVCLWSGFT